MKWIIGILLLGFIIFFHELGHFIFAKIFGVTVESFSIGFGPILLHKKHGTTDYRISAIPLGGYCGMKGEKDFLNAIETKIDHIEAEPGSLYKIHPLKRALIGFGGPLFNLIFAVIAYSVISMVGYTYYTYSSKIALANERGLTDRSAAAEAGLLTGDVITEINGKAIGDFSDIIANVSAHPDEDISVTVNRDGKILTFTVHTDFDKDEGTGKVGVSVFEDDVLKRETETFPFFPAIWNGIKQCGQVIALTVKSIAILFKGVKIQNAVSGPARITDMLGSTVQMGFSAGFRNGICSVLEFMGVISISLFIINLLPIPVLDGGLILFAFIQIIFRRQVHPKIQYYVQFIGLAFIAFLFVIGLTGDITYFMNVLKAGK